MSFLHQHFIEVKTYFSNYSTTLLWAVMLMALHPEVQTRCQSELDETLGERPLTIEEMSNLNYIMATLMEIQRQGYIN